MKLAVFHSVNSGLFFWDGAHGLLIDGIHDDAADGFSPMPDILRVQLRERSGLFAHLDGVLFTHLHEDHYDDREVRRLMETKDPPLLYSPELSLSNAPVRSRGDGRNLVELPGAKIVAVNTIHDGAPFRDEAHQSFVIRMGGECFFVAGDADFHEEDASHFWEISETPPTAGFFNLMQVGQPRILKFIRALAPSRIFLYHLPLREEDPYGLRSAARRIVKRVSAELPVEVLRHMAWIDGYRNNLEEMEIECDLPGIDSN